MIINKVHGNILESDIQSITVPVNTIGILGKGLALQFKQKYPDLLEPYRNACFNNTFNEHGLFVYTHSEKRKIICLPTKKEWWNPSTIKYVTRCLQYLSRDYKLYGITEIAIPPIGCGLGGLDWNIVEKIIYDLLDPIDLKVTIYLP